MVGEVAHARRLQSLHVTLIRHGQSLDNLTNVWAGHKDSPLTSTGLAQARALAESFAQIHIDAIYASDLKRASQTAHEVLNANRTIPPPLMVQTQSLREQHFGLAEGRDWTEAEWTNPNKGNAADARKLAFPEGESLEAVNARLTTAIRRFIVPRLEALRGPEVWSGPPPHVVIVAHGISIAEILRVLMSYHDVESSYPAPWPHPALAYKRVRLDNTGWTRLQLSVPFGQTPSTEKAAPPAESPQLLAAAGSNGKPDSGSTSPTPASKIPAQLSTADGGKAIQSAVEGEASATPVDPPSLLSQLPKPPRRDIFVKFVGHQNNIDHLAGFAMTGGIGSAANILGGGAATDNGGSRDTERHKESKGTGRGAVGGGLTRPDSGHGSTGRSRLNQSAATPTSTSLATGEGSGTDRRPSPTNNVSFGGSSSGRSGSYPDKQTPASSSDPFGHSGLSKATGKQLSFPPPAHTLQAPGASSDIWKGICARLLPLFGSEGLKTPIEEISESVSLHIRRTLDRGPARAWSSLTLDLRQLIGTGLLSLETRIGSGASPSLGEERQLLAKLAECWTAFGQILPWIEAAFLPLATDPVLLSLATGTPANGRSLPSQTLSPSDSHHILSSPGSSNTSHQPQSLLRSQPVDVKKLGLSVFRDSLVLPHYERLVQLFAKLGEVGGAMAHEGHQTGSAAAGARPSASATYSNPLLEEDATSSSSSGPLVTKLTQMVHILRSVQSGDDAQQGIDGLLRALRVGTSREGRASMSYSGGGGGGGGGGIPVSLSMGSTSGSYDRANRRGWVPPPSGSRKSSFVAAQEGGEAATGTGTGDALSATARGAGPSGSGSTNGHGGGSGLAPRGRATSPSPSPSSGSVSPLTRRGGEGEASGAGGASSTQEVDVQGGRSARERATGEHVLSPAPSTPRTTLGQSDEERGPAGEEAGPSPLPQQTQSQQQQPQQQQQQQQQQQSTPARSEIKGAAPALHFALSSGGVRGNVGRTASGDSGGSGASS